MSPNDLQVLYTYIVIVLDAAIQVFILKMKVQIYKWSNGHKGYYSEKEPCYL